MFTGLESDTKEIWKSATVKRSVDLEFLLYSGINGLFLQNSLFFFLTFAAHQFMRTNKSAHLYPVYTRFYVNVRTAWGCS